MRRRSGGSVSTSRFRMLLVIAFLSVVTYFNYRWALSMEARVVSSSADKSSKKASSPSSSKGTGTGIAIESIPRTLPTTRQPVQTNGNGPAPVDTLTSPPDRQVYNISYDAALQLYKDNLGIEVHQNVKQPTKDFFDVPENPDHGVLLPHDPTIIAPEAQYQACDNRNAEFTVERDLLCQQYLSNLNNMRSIKALSAILKKGRTIKFKIFYHHNGIEAIVKVSQMKFVFEPVSEYLAFALDRELNITRTPTSAYVALPLEYMMAASAVVSPFYSQWFKGFVLDYDFTSRYFVPCGQLPDGREVEKVAKAGSCSLVSIQLWMKDVHSALMSNLALPYEYDEHFAAKFYTPGHHKWPPKPLRLRAVGDINVRFIFDFLMGNTDRGMNDHNNFVYGGCDESTRCSPRPAAEQTKGIHKYAFIDHGSSFYSRKEPEENPFTGNMTDILICRFRRSTYTTFKSFEFHEGDSERHPLASRVKAKLPKNLFRVVSFSVFQQVQLRMEKIIRVIEACVTKYGETEVFSLPEYWEV